MCKQILAYIFAIKYLHIMEARRDVFQAIADPTRRQIIDMLVDKPLNVNALADNFSMSRQAVSLHVKILEECELIVIRKQGRERICEAKFEKLSEVATWVEQYSKYWEERFDALEKYLEKIQQKK